MEVPTSNPSLQPAPGQSQGEPPGEPPGGNEAGSAVSPQGQVQAADAINPGGAQGQTADSVNPTAAQGQHSQAQDSPAPGMSPEQAAADSYQAAPAGQAREETVNPAGTAAQGIHPENPGQAQAAPEFQQPQTAPPQGMAQASGLVMDPNTGQLYYTVPAGVQVQGQTQEPLQQAPYQTQNPAMAQQQIPPQPDYERVIKSVEDFAEGDATVADVVKTLYSETSQDDQFWKGALVGAAATVLLTNKSVKNAMGKTFGGIFGGSQAKAAAAPAPETPKE